MKKLTYLVIALPMLAISCTKDCNKPMTIVKDCSGAYLRDGGRDYHICNSGIVDTYADGTKVKATYHKITDCKDKSDEVVCAMYHANDGWIEITKISK